MLNIKTLFNVADILHPLMKYFMRILNFILHYMKKHLPLLWLGFFATIIAGLAEIAYPFMIQEITNTLLKSDTILKLTFNELLLLTAGLSLCIVLLHFIIILSEQKITSELGHDLRANIFSSVLRFPWDRIRKFHTGSLAFRIKNDTFLIGERIRTLYSDIVYDILSVTGPFVAMLFINVKLACLIAASIVISSVIIHPIIKKAAIYERMAQIYNSRFSGHIQESLSWIKTVKLYQAETFEDRRIAELNLKVKRIERIAGITMSLAVPLGYVAQFSSTLVVLGYGGKLLMEGAITPGSFVAIFVWEQLMADSVKRLGGYISVIYSLDSLIQRVSTLLTPLFCGARKMPPLSAEVNKDSSALLQLRLPSYGWYKGQELLKNVCLDIQRGERIILTGENGTGKSTLLDILLRLQPLPDNASLSLLGRNAELWSEGDWLNHFCLMNQHTQLVKGSLYENLIVASPSATDSELLTALRSAGGEALLRKCNNDLSTLIGEKGTSLSGGERQIIGLARVLLKDAPIVFFDEPTTHLDQDKVNNLLHIIQQMDPKKTVVIVSHDSRLFPFATRIIEVCQQTLHERSGL